MKVDACFQLGHLTGTHGLSGEMRAYLDTDRPENYKNLESVFVLNKQDQALIPFFIKYLKVKGDKAIIRFEDIDSIDEAKPLVGSGIFLPLEQLPALTGDKFYYHELVDWTVRDQNLGQLGKISSINLQSPQPLIVMDYQSNEVLIPFTDDIVLAIDRELEKIEVRLPDGLLDVYL